MTAYQKKKKINSRKAILTVFQASLKETRMIWNKTKNQIKIRHLSNVKVLKEILSLIQEGKKANGVQTSSYDSRILLFGKD